MQISESELTNPLETLRLGHEQMSEELVSLLSLNVRKIQNRVREEYKRYLASMDVVMFEEDRVLIE